MNPRLTLVLLLSAVVLLAALVQCVATAALAPLSRRARTGLLISLLVVYAVLLVARPPLLLLSNAIVFAVSAVVAVVLGQGLGDRRSLAAFALAASLADILSFLFGPTRALLDRFGGATGALVAYLTVAIPYTGQTLPVAGIGDLILLGVFFLGLRRLGYSFVASCAVPTLGLLAALAVGLAVGGIFGIPFMAAAVLLYTSARRPPPGLATALSTPETL
jgi:hypothetical protein